MITTPSFTVGIEEEYLLVDRTSRDLVREPTPDFLNACSNRLGERLAPEYLQCQIEVGTGVHKTVGAAGVELAGFRACLAEIAEAHGYAVIAASTHPFASWRDQRHTPRPRYEGLAADLGQTVDRMLICGFHVHIGIEDPDLRIDLMHQAAYFLPHLLALSCSSPFWEGRDTGLASYRLAVFDALPRTGLPDPVASHAEYRRMVEHLVAAGCIEDATKIWWDIRPSDRFPTLEQRVTDVCSRVSETVVVAALYQALLAFLFRLRHNNQRWRVYPPTLIMENRWRAQRYGAEGRLVDHGRATMAPFAELLAELTGFLSEDAEMLGCREALLAAGTIANEGTSATRQRAVHAGALEAGATEHEALCAVVDALIADYARPLEARLAPAEAAL